LAAVVDSVFQPGLQLEDGGLPAKALDVRGRDSFQGRGKPSAITKCRESYNVYHNLKHNGR
jgi:hypothetical protein